VTAAAAAVGRARNLIITRPGAKPGGRFACKT
jgi:hypothetical protein